MPAVLTRDGAWYTAVFVKKNQHTKTKTLNCAAIYKKVSFVHFLSQCRMKGKKTQKRYQEGFNEFWRAKVLHKTIRSQLKMLVTLRRFLAFENDVCVRETKCP
jgi:hypothetical protein